MRGSQGFTLVEVLVALSLALLVLALLGNTLIGSSRAAAAADGRNEGLNEVTIAQGLIVTRLREAIWVAPPDSAITVNDFRGRNPATGVATWIVPSGQLTGAGHHIVVMILPPGVGTNQYRLYAYYPVRRDVLRAGYAATAPERPAHDPGAEDSWVLMQLRADLGTARPTLPLGVTNLGTAGFTFSNITFSPLMEYVRTPLVGEPPLFAHRTLADAAATPPTVRVQSVAVNLRFARRVHGRVLLQPDVPQPLTVYPRNAGR